MTHKKNTNTSSIWIIAWIIGFVAIAYLISPEWKWLLSRNNQHYINSAYAQQAGWWCPMMRNTRTQWWGCCGGSRTTTTPTTTNVVDTTSTYETMNVWHDAYSLIPETVNLTAGKNYKLIITPSADGGWCMNTMTFPWLDSNVYPVKNGTPVTVVINDAKAGTYQVVCWAMWMHQWTIVIQ